MELYLLQRNNKTAITTGESKIIRKKRFLFNLLKVLPEWNTFDEC